MARDLLQAVVVIVDARRGLSDSDVQLFDFLQAHGIRPLAVLSKIDKLKQGERVRLLRGLREPLDGAIPFSVVSGEGERDLWRRLTELGTLR